MMEHAQYRAAMMADPHDDDAELRAHREACAECRAFTEQLLKFESRLERAMRVDFPPAADVLPFARKQGNAPLAARRLLEAFGSACRNPVWPRLWSRTWPGSLRRGGAPTLRFRSLNWRTC
jgi:hypothetical protein